MDRNIKKQIKEFLASGRPLKEMPGVLLVEIARARYMKREDGCVAEVPLKSVAAEIGVKHQMQVTRIIQEARRRKIVSIEINEPAENPSPKAELLRKYKHLKICEIVDCPENDHEPLMAELGKRAAEVLDGLYREKGRLTVSISGGSTLRRFVDALEPTPRRIVYSPTALLTRSPVDDVYDSPYLAMLAHWKSLPLSIAHATPIPPPSFDLRVDKDKNSKNLAKTYYAEWFRASKAVEAALRHASDADVAFLGVSDLSERSSTVNDVYNLFGYDFPSLYELGARINFNYSILDFEGRDLSSKLLGGISSYYANAHPFLPAVSPARFQEIVRDSSAERFVIVVAGALHKRKCIQTLLKCEYVNGLITDKDTVKWLAEEIKVTKNTEA